MYAEAYAGARFSSQSILKSVVGRMFGWLSGNPRIPASIAAQPVPDRLPVLIFSHGLKGNRLINSTICVDMASQGYYVAVLEHGDTSAGVRMLRSSPDDKEPGWLMRVELKQDATKEEETAYYENQLQYRTREVRACLDSLQALDDGSAEKELFINPVEGVTEDVHMDVFKGKLCTEKPVVAGHSMGGATTIRTLAEDPRFVAGVAFDSWQYPVRDDEVNLDRSNLLFVNCEKFQSKTNLGRMTKFETKLEKLGPVSSNVVNLRGAYHYASTDLNVILQGGWIGQKILGPPDPTFDQYEKVLANSTLWKGWVEKCLKAETASFIKTCQNLGDNIFFGIRMP